MVLERAYFFCIKISRNIDPAADTESDLFYVGDSLLALCVFDPGVTRMTLRLPTSEHGWYDGSNGWMPGGAEATFDLPAAGAPRALHKAGSVFAEDVSNDPGHTEPQLLFTVFAQETGAFSREIFFDDGESNAYLQNDCTRISFTVLCRKTCVQVRYYNRGKNAIQPDVRLIDRLNRPLELTKGDVL